MLIILDAELSDPPSSRTCFRDVTLYASIFIEADIVVECSPWMVDPYWKWLKEGGAMDFVEDIVKFGEVYGYSIRRKYGGNLNLDRLNETSLNKVITTLNYFKS